MDLSNVLEQVPGLAVLVWLVYVFLKHLREERAARQKNYEQRDSIIRDIAKESNQCHEQCARSIAESAEVIRQNTAALQRVAEHTGTSV